MIPFEIPAFEQVDAEDEHGQHQRSENHPHEPEERQPDEDPENRHQRMGIRQFLLHHEAHHVVDMRHHEHAVERQPYRGAPTQ